MNTASDLIGIAKVLEITGIRSPVTIWRRYSARPPKFPIPAGFILGRRAWRRAEVEAWRETELAKRESRVALNLDARAIDRPVPRSEAAREETARPINNTHVVALCQARSHVLRTALDEALRAIDEVESEAGAGTIFKIDWTNGLKLVRDSTDEAALRELMRRACDRLNGAVESTEETIDAVLRGER